MSRAARHVGRWLGAAAIALGAVAPAEARAFCGFYVGGAGSTLIADATTVVLMRDGTRTVLSMQNDYRGPPEDFAMVVPVPVVLHEDNVKTLPRDVFARVDAMTSPRLVEYWEQDPCAADTQRLAEQRAAVGHSKNSAVMKELTPQVQVEAAFAVGEYDVVILGAQDSGALDAWLKGHGYRIPEGAEPVLRPYVSAGSKFFVAKVNVDKVIFDGDTATLSPLRFHYDSDTFSLPVRLGLLSSGGTQDLIIHILSPGQRYEVANYPNVTIPTNIDVDDGIRANFGAFYAALFDRTLAKHPGAVVTEYAWSTAWCDPCPGPEITGDELRLLGADVLPFANMEGVVATRLHARYDRASLGEDLVFRAAPPIEGGRETDRSNDASPASPAEGNTFQARYAIRHEWTGPIACAEPLRGVWGRRADGSSVSAQPAPDLGRAPRGGIDLPALVRSEVPSLGLAAVPPPSREAARRTSRLAIGFGAGAAFGALAWLAAQLRRRRRHRAG